MWRNCSCERWAAHGLIAVKITEILERNRILGSRLTSSEYKIALISNIIVTQLREVLELTLREDGLKAEVVVGNYDAIVQDSSRFSDAKAVVVFWEASNLVEGLHNKATLMPPEDLDALEARVEGEIDLISCNLRSAPLVLINRFSSLAFDTNPLRIGPLSRMCKRLNASLEGKAGANQIIVDLDEVLAKVGLRASVDLRQYQSSKALYSFEFFKAYSEAVKPAFMAATGRAKKVLVLDCDNTLWGGILGEDGEAGIQMNGATSRGRAFREAQTVLGGLRKQGVLLALCSKNNPAEVDKILREHPDMILKDEDLVAKKVNWQDKATNLQELATDLNLGLESFVLLDDSEFELGLIQKELPQVKCVQVPRNLSEFPSVVRELGREFFTLSKSAEDDQKTEMYQRERLRKDQAARFASIEQYLASLNLEIRIVWDAGIPVSRAAQMAQKTNQFNLTTRRYTEADIQRMLGDPACTLAVFSVADRYGDYGVTGMAIIRYGESAGTAAIDSLLMSCRVIGRNIEYVFLDEIVLALRDRGVSSLRAEYLATAKNSQVERFFDDLGFSLISNNQSRREYQIRLADYEPREIKYIKNLRTGH